MPAIESNMYVLLGERSALIIDPYICNEALNLISCKGIKKCIILLTHEHFDHISGVELFKNTFDCCVICTKKCGELIRNPKKNGASTYLALFINKASEIQEEAKRWAMPDYSCIADLTYEYKMTFEWENLMIELSDVRGHSNGSQIIKVGNHAIFSGDNLIPGTQVILRLPGGDRKMYEKNVLPYIDSLSPNCVIFPGHGKVALLGSFFSSGRL